MPSSWQYPSNKDFVLTTVPLVGSPIKNVKLPFRVERVDAIGAHALFTGSRDSALYVSLSQSSGEPTTLRLAVRDVPRVSGMVYRSNSDGSGIAAYVVRGNADAQLDELSAGNASVIFVRRTGAQLETVGEVDASVPTNVNDKCTSGCFDWYDNSTTVFAGNRIFAIFGYEVVEAELRNGKIVEKQRISTLPLH
jgi:hypothetical protein